MTPSPLEHPLPNRARVGVAGKTGSGKSTLAKAIAAAELARGARVLAFDPHDEWSRLGSDYKGEVTLGPLGRRMTVAELCDDPSALDDPRLSLAVVPEAEAEPDEVADDFKALASLVKDTGGLTFFVDEIGEFGAHCEATLNKVGTGFRKFRVPVVITSQRVIQIPKTCRTQLSHLVSFLQDDAEDLDALRKRQGPDFADRVSRLGQHKFEVWRDGSFSLSRKATAS